METVKCYQCGKIGYTSSPQFAMCPCGSRMIQQINMSRSGHDDGKVYLRLRDAMFMNRRESDKQENGWLGG